MRAKNINKALIALFLFLIMTLQGCSSKADEPFRVAFNNRIGHGPLYLPMTEVRNQDPTIQRMTTSSTNDVLAVLQNRIAGFKNILPVLMEDLYQALDRVNQRERTALLALSEYLGLTPTVVNRVYEGIKLPGEAESRRLLYEQPILLEEQIQSMEKQQVDEALLNNQHQIKLFIWNQYFQGSQ
jgi:hypothetical protein